MSLLPHCRLALFTAFVALISLSSAPAGADEKDQPVHKIYDIRDLLVQVPDFTDAPHVGIETPAEPESAAKAVPTGNELIERQIEWIRSGLGSDAAQVSLTEEAGQLKVTANPQAQKQIERMLDQARSLRSTQVTVEIRELCLSSTDELPRDLRLKLHEAFAPNGKPVELAGEDVHGLLKAAQAGRGSTIVTAPRLTVFDGQRAYVVLAQQKAYRAGVGLSEVNGRRVAEPLTSSVSTGMVVKVRPAVDDAGTHVALDLQFEQAKLLDMRKEPAPEPGQKFAVEVPVIDRVQVDRTLCAPVGRTLLIAIPSTDSHATPGAGTRVLLVRATVIKPEPK